MELPPIVIRVLLGSSFIRRTLHTVLVCATLPHSSAGMLLNWMGWRVLVPLVRLPDGVDAFVPMPWHNCPNLSVYDRSHTSLYSGWWRSWLCLSTLPNAWSNTGRAMLFSVGLLSSLSVSSSSLSLARRANLLLCAFLAQFVETDDCFWFADVVASRNRAGVSHLYVLLYLSKWVRGRVKETFRGTVLTTPALLYDLVQWAISWFAGGTIIAGVGYSPPLNLAPGHCPPLELAHPRSPLEVVTFSK